MAGEKFCFTEFLIETLAGFKVPLGLRDYTPPCAEWLDLCGGRLRGGQQSVFSDCVNDHISRVNGEKSSLCPSIMGYPRGQF
ncbi:hypothetical protein MHYP_G00251630 [Metynnis hypsauchen]